MAGRPSRIVLTGFSGTGKSVVAPIVAERLGWRVIDTDPLIEERTGKRILEIFRDEGEERFRELEAEALRDACSHDGAVISTGGGAILRASNRRALAEGGFIVCLEARPETILSRLGGRAQSEPLDRPLLAVEDPLRRIRELKAERQHIYALADWVIQTDSLTLQEVSEEVQRSYETVAASALSRDDRIDAISNPAVEASSRTLHAIPQGAAAMVTTAAREYPVFVGWGILSELGNRLRDAGLGRHVHLVSDEAVYHHLGDEAEAALTQGDVPFDSFTVPPGEASKTLGAAADIYDWLIENRAERRHTVVALGGGVVTDLGGYAAATFARGLPLVHVPTSLLGMVDAAIGGKVAVNHPQAKNMIGAFYQPHMVLADVATLRTLPPRELHSGWAEVIKHALIADEDYLQFLEENAARILKLEPDAITEAVRRSVGIKARVVSEDEREESGLRTTLNYGHTLAHAIESATGYNRYLHGEAVAIGMMAAAAISAEMGMLDSGVIDRQRALLERYNLPLKAEGLDRGRIHAAMKLDKKIQAKTIQWVLLEGIGRPVLSNDVPPDAVDAAISAATR